MEAVYQSLLGLYGGSISFVIVLLIIRRIRRKKGESKKEVASFNGHGQNEKEAPPFHEMWYIIQPEVDSAIVAEKFKEMDEVTRKDLQIELSRRLETLKDFEVSEKRRITSIEKARMKRIEFYLARLDSIGSS